MPFISQTFGQSVKVFYKVPSREGGSITFEPGRRMVVEGGKPKLIDDHDGFVIKVEDCGEEPAIVRAPDLRFDQKSRKELGLTVWTYTTGEEQLRTGIAKWIWRPAFVHIVLPALFTALFSIGVILVFRFYRDIVWKRLFARAARVRDEDYKRWRVQP